MKKHIANVVSFSRVIGAVILFCQKEFSALFLVVYTLCGVTDLIDGPIARKTNSTSTIGATLDTVGDVATYLALTKILTTKKMVPLWIFIWILSAGIMFGVAAVISKVRFKKLYLPHTYLGKLFGGAVFVLPIMIQFMPKEIWMSAICTIATIHVFELIFIQSKNSTPDDFVATVFHINRGKTAE